MAVPKRKISKSRRDKRRAANFKLSKPNLATCPQCHEPKLPHRACRSCGYYKNKEVISVE